MRLPGSFLIGIVVTTLLCACGDDKTSSPGGASSGTPSSSGSTEQPAGDSGVSTTPSPNAAGPKITKVMKMTGALHVMWELPKECDGVELERKGGEGDFVVEYELPGTVDNKHDGEATENVLYTYRARCKVGAEYTEYSNEMSMNPK